MTLQQQRATEIERLELDGRLDPECQTCVESFYPFMRTEWKERGDGPFAPSHKASERCKSGKLAHCTCDTCF
jgi:hypothetical protein